MATIAPAAPMRLTQRGVHLLRVVALTAALMLCIPLVAALTVGRGTAGDGPTAPVTSTVVVQPGDTLWGIAARLAPQADPRAVIERIRDLNGLGGGPITPGQQLVVPRF